VAGVSDSGFEATWTRNTGSRRGVVDISHHLSHPNCAHEHKCASMSKIGRGTWQSWRVIHTLIDTANPELVSNRINPVHGRRSLLGRSMPNGTSNYHLPCRCRRPPSCRARILRMITSHAITRARVTVTRWRGGRHQWHIGIRRADTPATVRLHYSIDTVYSKGSQTYHRHMSGHVFHISLPPSFFQLRHLSRSWLTWIHCIFIVHCSMLPEVLSINTYLTCTYSLITSDHITSSKTRCS